MRTTVLFASTRARSAVTAAHKGHSLCIAFSSSREYNNTPALAVGHIGNTAIKPLTMPRASFYYLSKIPYN